MAVSPSQGLDKGVVLQLQMTPLFSGIAEADIRDLVAGAQVVCLAHGQGLYEEGEPVLFFYLVLDGHVELSVVSDNCRSIVEVVRGGALLGDAALFSGGRFMMSARVLTGATVLVIPAQSFKAKLDGRFDILLHMLSTLSLRLRMLVRQIAELKLKTTAQRLGGFLLSHTEAVQGRVVIRFPYDKKLVAEELGMKAESLSRALVKLARLGVNSRPDNAVEITDVVALRQFCTEDDFG